MRRKDKQRQKRLRERQGHQPRTLVMVEYTVTEEPMGSAKETMPAEVAEQFSELYELVPKDPEAAIQRIKPLLEKYPEVRELYTFLASAASRVGQTELAEQTAAENLRRHPRYLFAKLNYAEILLATGRLDRVAEVLEHRFMIQEHLPGRKKYHVTEFVNFHSLVGRYLAAVGKREEAQVYLDMIEKLCPGHEATKELRRALHPSLLGRLLRGLRQRADAVIDEPTQP